MHCESALINERESPESVFADVFRQMRPRTRAPDVEVSFGRFAGITSTVEWTNGVLRVKISDVLESAPPSVMEALAWILLGKMLRKPVAARYRDRYKRHLNKKEVVEKAEQTRRQRGHKRLLPPEGRCFDLQRMFEDLNFHYFHGLMSRPVLGWSAGSSRTILGHYDPAHHAIVLSRILDRAEIPPIVVEYVLFHEMLHLRYPIKRAGSKCRVHTAEFREAEAKFAGYVEATKWLEREFGGLSPSREGD